MCFWNRAIICFIPFASVLFLMRNFIAFIYISKSSFPKGGVSQLTDGGLKFCLFQFP